MERWDLEGLTLEGEEMVFFLHYELNSYLFLQTITNRAKFVIFWYNFLYNKFKVG